MGNPFKAVAQAFRAGSKAAKKSQKNTRLIPKKRFTLTPAQRTTQMYNRRDIYAEVLYRVIREHPEEFNTIMPGLEALMRAHQIFLRELAEGKIQLPQDMEWMRNVEYDIEHGATSMEDFLSPIDLYEYLPEGATSRLPAVIQKDPYTYFIRSENYGYPTDFWEDFLDPGRLWFTGFTDWTNIKK